MNKVRRDHPLEVSPQKPFDHSHEVDCSFGLKEALKFGFDSRVLREENEIINVKAEREGRRGWGVVGIGRVDNMAGK